LRLDFAAAEAPSGPAVGACELWFQRALRLEQEERLDEAVQAYSRALDPAHPRPEVAFNLGNALYALGRGEEACAAYALATELDPEYVEAWNNLGNALSVLARHTEAIRCFQRALELEPDYADAHFNLAETHAAQGSIEPAREHWRTYLEHDPDSPWAAEVRARLRRTDRSRSETALPLSPTSTAPLPR
jgi:tetratricopeptide (TPR) repeat protein